MFGQFLLPVSGNEVDYILFRMIEEDLIESTFVSNRSSKYYMHLKQDPSKSKSAQNTFYVRKHHPFSSGLSRAFTNEKRINIFDQPEEEDLERDDFKLHKQLAHEGFNPLEIAKVIRNDDIDELQEIASHPNFNSNAKISKSQYERYTELCNKDVTLIQYAAFYGSIKCFKFLMLNYAKLKGVFEYAIAGGNIEIFHHCIEFYPENLERAYEIAIKYHRNDIFVYLCENENANQENDGTFNVNGTSFGLPQNAILKKKSENAKKFVDFDPAYKFGDGFNLYTSAPSKSTGPKGLSFNIFHAPSKSTGFKSGFGSTTSAPSNSTGFKSSFGLSSNTTSAPSNSTGFKSSFGLSSNTTSAPSNSTGFKSSFGLTSNTTSAPSNSTGFKSSFGLSSNTTSAPSNSTGFKSGFGLSSNTTSAPSNSTRI
ncbi:cask-interacting protein (caskin) 1,2 [Histomonas meleagridis]|nr:cask-interacting protein (caskin) 1,2 [Histomonas meleagridis]